jgi:hypothetical protein
MLASFNENVGKQKRSNLRPIDEIFGYPERDGSRVHSEGVNEKCLLTSLDLKKKPGFYAYQNLCALWRSEYVPHSIKYNIKIVDEGIFYGVVRRRCVPISPIGTNIF